MNAVKKNNTGTETENDGSVYALLHSFDREGFSDKVIFEQRPQGSSGASYVCIWKKRAPSRGNSKYKNPEMRA